MPISSTSSHNVANSPHTWRHEWPSEKNKKIKSAAAVPLNLSPHPSRLFLYVELFCVVSAILGVLFFVSVNMRYSSAFTLASAGLATATNLYVSSYAGTITTLNLDQTSNGSYTLAKTFVNYGSFPSPSWLTLDPLNKVLYCLDENLSGANGSISSYSTSSSGLLTQIDRHSVVTGAVSSIIYNGGKAQAAAHYSGSSVTSWAILSDGGLEPLQQFTFNLSAPGPNPARQDAPHPHEALVDPTDSFILVPDLGADLVRIFSINATTSEITPVTPLVVPPGSGPRHGAFLVEGNTTYFFLISELGNTVVSYEISYEEEGELEFVKLFSSGTFGPDLAVPVNTTSAEVLVSPDHRFVLTSSRNDTYFTIPSFDPTDSTPIISDSLQTWAINPNGTLTFEQLAPAGGSFPRQFSVNKNGTLAAVGLQYSASVVIIERNANGTFGDFVAEIEVDGQITSVVWDE